MKISICALAFLLAFPMCVHAAQENDPNGFRGIAWGTDVTLFIPEFEDITGPSAQKFTRMYKRSSDNMVIGGASVDKIIYVYWMDKFYEAIVLSKGRLNFEPLRDALVIKFGGFIAANQDGLEMCIWKFENSDITLAYRKNENDTMLLFVSTMVEKEIREQRVSDAISGAQAGF